MDWLTTFFSRVLNISKETNFEYVGTSDYAPSIPQVNHVAIENHQRTLHVAFKQFLSSDEIDYIENQHKRTDLSPETITDDFYSGDIEQHPEPTDIKSQLAIETGLQCLTSAWAPPRPAQPVNFYDVQHHYPYKWQVNAELPFVSDKYFLDKRLRFSDFFDPVTKLWTKYVNPEDALRRYGPDPHEDTLKQVTPPKFGFMKQMIFNTVHLWLHYVKMGFPTNGASVAGPYFYQRFIFPMLLHIKTAVVKFDAPNKLRSIWGVSKTWIIAETQIYWEYIAWIKLNPGTTPMLWGYETFTGGWFRLYRDLFSPVPLTYVTIDWSRFDKRAHFWLIRKIFTRTRFFFNFEDGYVPTFAYPSSPTAPFKLFNLWSWTIENFFDAPIILPDGKMYKRRFSGIPSGLFITQLMDSWYNYVMLCSILAYLDIDPRLCIIKVQGDDSIIRLAVLIPEEEHENFLSQMQSAADHLFGSIISMEKTEIRNDLNGAEILSYRNINGMPHRDVMKMLAQFYHTKAKDPTPEITMAQAIGFSYAACGNDVRIHELLRSIYDYYKEKGFSPNPAGISLVFGDSPDRPDYPIELDHFPDIFEVQRFFVATDYINAKQFERTWPRTIFKYAPCNRD